VSAVLVHGVAAATDRLHMSTPGARCIEHGEFSAIVTEADPAGLRAASALRLHWQVLEEAAATATVIPVRFGTAMASDRAVVDELLAPRHDELVSLLAQLAGKLQITVKGEFDEERLMRGIVEGSPAVARLRERVDGVPAAAAYYDRIRLGQMIADQVEAARERCGDRVHERLAPMSVATSRERTSSPNAAVNAAFLLEADAEPEFRAAVGELQREFAGMVRLRCVGPLPPYSFCDLDSAPRSSAWA
jgi:hypothetical protein